MLRSTYLFFLLTLSLASNCTQQQACATLRCDHGNVVDSNGCATCACLPAPIECVCGSQCKTHSGSGVCGADGKCSATELTPSCPSVCSDMMCAMYCADGYQTDVAGCPTCACKEPLTSTEKCPCGRLCEMSGGGQGVCQTDGVTCAVNIVAPQCTTCSNLLCRMYCEYGNVVDEKGCRLCACNPNPHPTACPCGTPCKMQGSANAEMGICGEDEITCLDSTIKHPILCGKNKCPEMMCMIYCPFGSVVGANGCPTCTCNPDPTPCVCGQSCALSATEKGVCQKDGTCGLSSALEQTPCAPVCDGMMCKMYCPYGNVLSSSGCPSCQCNPAPAIQACICGEACKTVSGVGVCQSDGTCDALSTEKPVCKPVCPAVMCMMYCEHGTMLDETTHCPTCKCNSPPVSCVCGESCVSGRGNGTCQSDGMTCASVAVSATECDKRLCPAVRCALYCPNGNAMDENGCMSCRCNPAPLGSCSCGERCKQPTTGEVGICQQDGVTCGPIQDKGLVCDKKCPSLMCNLFCPNGNKLDENGCATCACLPYKAPCSCGETCWQGGRAGVCMDDGSCGPLAVAMPVCKKQLDCPAVRCMVFCPGGNEVDLNGCPTCRCKKPKPCPCGQKCQLNSTTAGICSADDVCSPPELASACPICPAKMCMMFCPKGNVIDANGCSTCRCLNDECPCGTPCKTNDHTPGVCRADGQCVARSAGLFHKQECAPAQLECPQMKCMHYCPEGNAIDDQGCPTCECKVHPEPLPCPCGTKCATGVCQEDGKTCAMNIRAPVCKPFECPKVMCMMFCPHGNAVDDNGCPSCKCNPAPEPCPCGQACTMKTGGSGVCQTDGVTCAVNIMPPRCFMTALVAAACVPPPYVEEERSSFCEAGGVVVDGCPTNKCLATCPCGDYCYLPGGTVGTCQSDGSSCAETIAMCLTEPAPEMMAADGTSSVGVIVTIVVISLILAVSVGLLLCRRGQRKVAPERNYADLAPTSGYVAPVNIGQV